ncbi:MAG: sugar transferase [Verrucomicrobiales bacterium]|nr:sugar transferase [Verrucomicrobiales bacterium]
MLRRQRIIRDRIHKFVDATLFALGFYLAFALRSNAESIGPWLMQFFQVFGGTPEIQSFRHFSWYVLLTVPAAMILLGNYGFYSRPLITSRRQTILSLFKTCTVLTIGIIILMFLNKEVLSRAVIILFGVFSFTLVLLKEEGVRWWIRTGLQKGHFERRLILVGTADDTKALRHQLSERERHGIRILAELDVNESPVDQLVEILHEQSANGVVLAARHTFFGQLEKVIHACELEGVEVWLLADFFKTQISRTTVDDFYGRPMMVFRSTPEMSWQAVGKQVIDFIGALLLVIAVSPVMLLAALAVRVTSPGPVVFKQMRSGLNGRPFTMYKFRTMVTDAEQRKQELAAFNEMSGPVFKVTNDPRITRVGSWLRKFSIDEFPQLLNVLRGEMSLVGPRPLPVDETRRFDDLAHRRRLSVKPGLTCLWQISGRNNVTDFREWVRLDLEYIDNWSLWLDLKILFRTIPIVLMGSGAK